MTGRRFAALFSPLLVMAGVSCLSLALAGCDVIFPHRTEGEKLWRKHCAECHGLDGAGNTPGYMGNSYADLKDDHWKTGGASQTSFDRLVRAGVFGKMPAYSSEQLSRQQLREIYEHLRVLRGEKQPPRQP
jgi:mono/diheme cytochrome c family protein